MVLEQKLKDALVVLKQMGAEEKTVTKVVGEDVVFENVHAKAKIKRADLIALARLIKKEKIEIERRFYEIVYQC